MEETTITVDPSSITEETFGEENSAPQTVGAVEVVVESTLQDHDEKSLITSESETLEHQPPKHGTVTFEGPKTEDDKEIQSLESVTKVNPITARFYPGDLICYQPDKPYYGWNVCYGKVVSSSNPLAELWEYDDEESKTKEPVIFIKPPDSKNLNYEEGLKAPIYIQWISSNRVSKFDNFDQLRLVDRELAMGQRVMNNDKVKGSVTGTFTSVAVQILNTNHVIENIDVLSLNPVSPFVRGREILSRGWIGVITKVERSVTTRLDNGPTFTHTCIEADGFMKIDPYSGPGSPCPGSRIKFTPTAIRKATFQSKSIRAISTLFPSLYQYYASSPGSTTKVEALSLEVKWLQRCPTSTGTVSEVEPDKIIKKNEFKNIKLLGFPSHLTVGLNSTRMYAVQPKDSIISYPAWFKGFQSRIAGDPSLAYRKSYPLPLDKSVVPGSGYPMPVKVIEKQTYATVDWDDGRSETLRTSDIPYLLPFIESNNFPVGLIVQSIFDQPGPKKYGVVQQADEDMIRDKTIIVRWIVPDTENENKETLDLGLKKESIYDIKPHEKYCFYQKGTALGIRDSAFFYEAGTVVDLDIFAGKVVLTVPYLRTTISVWPHDVVPITKKCYWNFFHKNWILEEILPPFHHMFPEPPIGPEQSIPVSLNANNNNSTPALKTIWNEPSFELLSDAPGTHHYYNFELKTPSSELLASLRADIANLKDNLPDGIWVRGYEDRMDIFSVVILGPEDTPFEDGLYFFDVQIPIDFPARQPKIHQLQYGNAPASHFFASDGTFCASKLEWEFTEKPPSYIANALGQLQKLIFTSEPYFQMPGKESEIDTPYGNSESRAFNEQIFLGLLTASYYMAMKPAEPWREIIARHLSMILPEKINAVNQWIKLLDAEADGRSTDMDVEMPPAPSFKILPISEGFKLAVTLRIEKLRELFPCEEVTGGMDNEETAKSDASASTINRLIETEAEKEKEIAAKSIEVD